MNCSQVAGSPELRTPGYGVVGTNRPGSGRVVGNSETSGKWDSRRFPRFELPPTAERLLGRQTLWTQIRWPQGRDGSTPFSGTILTYTDLTFFDFKFVMSQAVIPEGTH